MNPLTRIKILPIPLKIFLVLLFMDLVIVLLHITIKIPFFNLDEEFNFPTFYQTTKVLTLGILSLFILLNSHILKIKQGFYYILFLLTIAFSSLYLAMDEMLQIHESIVDKLRFVFGRSIVSSYESVFYDAGYSASNWLIFYIPVLIIGGIFLLFLASKLKELIKKEYILILIVFIFVLIVLVMEYFGTGYRHSPEVYLFFVTIEELSEMLAMSVLSLFMLNRYVEVFSLKKS